MEWTAAVVTVYVCPITGFSKLTIFLSGRPRGHITRVHQSLRLIRDPHSIARKRENPKLMRTTSKSVMTDIVTIAVQKSKVNVYGNVTSQQNGAFLA